MTLIYLLTAAVVLITAPSLWSLHRRPAKAMQRLTLAAERLRVLNEARAAFDLAGDEHHQTLGAAITEVLIATGDVSRKGGPPVAYAALMLLMLLPLAAIAIHQWGSPHAELVGTHAGKAGGTAPPINHGTDMQAAISKLAEKLRQHPDDAEGWALLGRTYKALQQYAQARDAFGHALAASPANAELAREYANAETPNSEPATLEASAPSDCAVSGLDCPSALGELSQSAAHLSVRTMQSLKIQDGAEQR